MGQEIFTKKARYVVVQLAIGFKWKRKRKKKFGVRLGKKSRGKDYKKAFGARLGLVSGIEPTTSI